MSLLFNLIAFLLILFIVWWFWLYKEKVKSFKENLVKIEVKDGIYSPSTIKTSHANLTLEFIRKDASPCSEFVVFQNLDVHEQLPLNQAKKINLKNLKPGKYKFACQMNMYQGILIVDN